MNFSQDVFHLAGRVTGDGPGSVFVGFDRQRRKKKISVDGKDTPRVSVALGRLGAVVFSPADAELVAGGPRIAATVP